MPDPNNPYPNKPLGPVPKQGFGLNAAQAPPALNEVNPSPNMVVTPPTGPPGPQPTPTAAPTPSPTAQRTTPGVGFNINDLLARPSNPVPQDMGSYSRY